MRDHVKNPGLDWIEPISVEDKISVEDRKIGKIYKCNFS